MDSPPFCKMVYSKWSEFAPKGSKFFPFIVDPLKSSSLFRATNRVTNVPLSNMAKKYQMCPVPLIIVTLQMQFMTHVFRTTASINYIFLLERQLKVTKYSKSKIVALCE